MSERALPGGDKHQIVVHADIETLAGGDDIEQCEIENGPNIHPETLRRLGCDCVGGDDDRKWRGNAFTRGS